MTPLEPPPGRQVFSLAITPEPTDIDENGHVNNVVYLRWVQDIATAHWRAKAPADQRDLWGWIALRHEIDYRRALKLHETATARTWVSETAEGPRMERFVRIDGPDGAICSQTRTTWCLIDAATGRPKRVPDWMPATFA
jgi:acyl-CoA thioester hydrolase